MEPVLLIDDDVELCSMLEDYLTRHGFSVAMENDGELGLHRALTGEFAIVLLDVMLPGLDGFEVLRRLRTSSQVSVLLLTARGEDIDRIVGLEIGADDYLPKPFNPRELLARIRAILRRTAATRQAQTVSQGVNAGGSSQIKHLSVAGIELDSGARTAICNGVELELTNVEFELLGALMEAPGQILSREHLTECVLDRRFNPFDRSLDMHVSRLRRKLDDAAGLGDQIKTIRSVGYQLALPVAVPGAHSLSGTALGAAPPEPGALTRMRSTFTKIFLSFWLSEFLILACTVFILGSQFEANEIVYTSVFSMMYSNANLSVRAYESGGCKALTAVPNTFSLDVPGSAEQPAILFDSASNPLCQTVSAADHDRYGKAVAKILKQDYLLGERHGTGFLEGVEVKDAQGQKFAYLVRGSYPKEAYIPYRELAPRLLIGLIVSVLVTFGITMLITRPIGSLRKAARQLAAGDLQARARWPRGRANRKSSDELWGLVYDFNEMADRLESLVDAQMLLLRDVSHELRSPLARLSVALELAREEAQPGMEVQLDRIERETGRLNSLIGQLLSLSHLESSKRLPDKQRISLGELVAELLPDMDYEAQRRNCAVAFAGNELGTGTDEGRVEVLGSRELLGRAAENIIRNAIAYTAEGTSVEIRIFDEQRAGTRFAVLQVKDHGPGVPDAALKSIFRPFYRLDLSRQRSTGGYGVGLAITERAVRLHGGAVTARNAAEGGLIVEMRLPVAGQDAD